MKPDLPQSGVIQKPKLCGVDRLRSGLEMGLWVRAIVALLLWAAASAKGYQLATSSVEGNRFWLIAQVEIEWLMGLLLVSGVAWKSMRVGAIILFLIMACYSAWLISHSVESCGCFGLIRVNPWWTLVVDCLVVIALVAIGYQSEAARVRTTLQKCCVLSLALAIGLPAAWLMASFEPAHLDTAGQIIGESRQVVLEPENWRGKLFPLLPHLQRGSQFQRGHWKILLYHHDCANCAEILEHWPGSLSADSNQDTKLAIIVLPPAEGANSELELLTPRPLIDTLSASRDWIVTTPTILTLNRGVVIKTSHDPAKHTKKVDKSHPAGKKKSTAKSERPVRLVRNSKGQYDLGYIEPGSAHRIRLEIENPLHIPLEIRKIQPECDCMRVLNPPQRILPGKTPIVVSFQSIKKRLDYSKRILFHTNHKQLRLIGLSLHARIGLALRLEPQRLKLGKSPAGKVVQRQVLVHNDSNKPYKILYGTSDNSRVVAQVGPDSLLPGKSQSVPIKIDLKGAVPGEYAATLRFATNSPGQRSLRLDISYRVNAQQ